MHEIVPPERSKPPRQSRLLLGVALVLGAAAIALFGSGQAWLAVTLAIPAAILGVFAARHTIRPFVIHIARIR